jgi:hypothetical protein
MNNIKRIIPQITNITKRFNSSFQREFFYISNGESIKSYLKSITSIINFDKETYYQVSIKTVKRNENNLSCDDIQTIQNQHSGYINYGEKKE